MLNTVVLLKFGYTCVWLVSALLVSAFYVISESLCCKSPYSAEANTSVSPLTPTIRIGFFC